MGFTLSAVVLYLALHTTGYTLRAGQAVSVAEVQVESVAVETSGALGAGGAVLTAGATREGDIAELAGKEGSVRVVVVAVVP